MMKKNRMVLVLDSFTHPSALSDTWCLFELYCAALAKCEVSLSLV